MKEIVEERAARLGEYIVEQKATVRAAAGKFGISKSTVHKDVSKRLPYIDSALYLKVNKVLQQNKSERHIRGGEATKNKYLILSLRDNKGDNQQIYQRRQKPLYTQTPLMYNQCEIVGIYAFLYTKDFILCEIFLCLPRI
ncbi:MAG: sporulation transcriptional regulator SpoIIID [Clostridia bacterium]|nr:sporulation transcriptional regulator SpoIIID [Clostridia bacterium]